MTVEPQTEVAEAPEKSEETGKTENTQEVLSQSNQSDATTEPTEAEKAARRAAYQERIKRREWRNQIDQTRFADVDDHEINEVMAQIREQGLETRTDDGQVDVEATRKQAAVIAKSNARQLALRHQKEMAIKTKAANATLGQTLKDIGYDPAEPAYTMLGNALFRRHGVDNPDLYDDPDFVRRECEAITASLTRKASSGDTVATAVTRRAAKPPPNTESRFSKTSDTANEAVKQYAKERGVSEEKAKRLMELEKGLRKSSR